MLSWLKKEKVDHSLADARQAKEVIDAFPVNDPWQTLEDASHWLDSINTTEGFGLGKRFELIDALDVATRRAQRKLLDTYLALKVEDKIQERRIWNSVTSFWRLLTAGYLACIAQARDNKNVTGAIKPMLPVMAARGTRALRNQLKWVLMRYSMVRPGMWSEIARCTAFAEVGGFAGTMVEVYSGEQGSVHHELLRAMMFWAASPGGLSPPEQDIAERILIDLTPQFGLTDKQTADSFYCFDLNTPRSPLRVTQAPAPTADTRFFDAVQAHKATQSMLAAITSTGALPSAADFTLGPGASVTAAIRVLNYLQVNWAKEMRARAGDRRQTALSLQMVHGYQNVLTAIAPELGDPDEGLDFSSDPVHETVVAEDVSTGGYGLIVPAAKAGWVKVGVLVGVRAETESLWSVGVVRRVKGDAHQQFRIGVQLIAKAPVLVRLSAAAVADRSAKPSQHALLLGTKPSQNGSLHILARRDIFSGGHLLEGAYGNPVETVMLDAVGAVESGDDFDWLRYKLYEPI